MIPRPRGEFPGLKQLWLPLDAMEDDCGSILLRADGPFRRLYAGGAQFGSSALFHPIRISLMTTRGRALGEVDALLVDLPWQMVTEFVKHTAPRGAYARLFLILGFAVADSCLEAARRWIGGDLDAETAQGYATAEEFDAEEGVDPPGQIVRICLFAIARPSPSQVLDFPSWKRRPPTAWSF